MNTFKSALAFVCISSFQIEAEAAAVVHNFREGAARRLDMYDTKYNRKFRERSDVEERTEARRLGPSWFPYIDNFERTEARRLGMYDTKYHRNFREGADVEQRTEARRLGMYDTKYHRNFREGANVGERTEARRLGCGVVSCKLDRAE